MRIDHHAYQRATRVAGVGFLVQLGIGLTLLIFSLVGTEQVPQDTAFLFGSLYILLGLLVWLGLIVIFNQHKLERLEALEEDELAASRERPRDSESVFTAEEEMRVAARRLRLMHKWFMPATSLVLAAALSFLAWLMLRQLSAIAEGLAEYRWTVHIGWAVAICLAFSAVSFIVSRFVAGMAKQPAWQNLRGGAAYMVGNALVTLAIAVGIGFRFFENENVIRGVAYAIPIFMIVVAAEIVLNFILNLYRPRIPGETPRPAFDSKLLSLFSAPDSLVRSINEAVNYQFGFDITSSWGYQLLIRSVAWLGGLGALSLVVLNMIVIVEPYEQAVKLSRGRMVGDEAHGSGVMWKLPWPLQTAETYDVTRIRELHLTGKQVARLDTNLWTDDLGKEFDKPLEPFMVGRSQGPLSEYSAGVVDTPAMAQPPAPTEQISDRLSLVDAEIMISYRIKEDGGLLDYLDFSSDRFSRRDRLTGREVALRAIALREVTQGMADLTLDDVLAVRRLELPGMLRDRVQRAFDASRTGVQLVAVDLLLLRPAGDAAGGFEELNLGHQARQQHIANAEQRVVAGLAQLVGASNQVDAIVAGVTEYDALRDEFGAAAPETLARRVEVEQMLVRAGGRAGQTIVEAERDRWVRLLRARGDASRLHGQIGTYRAAPRLFRVRETMIVYANTLSPLQKYIFAIDPSRVSVDVDIKELNPLFNIGDAFDEESGRGP